MHLLIPGRHHLLTEFQLVYLNQILGSTKQIFDLDGKSFSGGQEVESVIFAVTSANHSGTKRNPLPFHLRAMAIQTFSESFDVPIFVYGIDDAGQMDNFDEYTVKTIAHNSNYRFELTPDNTVVICSTPVPRTCCWSPRKSSAGCRAW